MKYKLVCTCGAYCWVKGTYEHDTNATELDGSKVYEWECGDPNCIHENNEITDSTVEEFEDNVI